MTFVQDDLVVIDRESIDNNWEKYNDVGRPFDLVPHTCYDDIVGVVYHPMTIPFVGYLVDWGIHGMLPMHPFEIKRYEDGKDTDGA